MQRVLNSIRKNRGSKQIDKEDVPSNGRNGVSNGVNGPAQVNGVSKANGENKRNSIGLFSKRKSDADPALNQKYPDPPDHGGKSGRRVQR